MRHEDSLCGIHVSDIIFNGLETFLRDHTALRRDLNLPIRNDLREDTIWTRIPASATTTSRQKDGVSCGILTCGNATCRVYNMPGFPFGQSYVPQMRLHMYHCILQDTFYPISLSIADESINERMSATAIWYSGHQARYENILALRASRPLPPVIIYVGQGTAEAPFDLESEIARVEPETNHSQEIERLSPSMAAFSRECSTEPLVPVTESPRPLHQPERFSIRSNDSVHESEDESLIPPETTHTMPLPVKPKLRRPAFRAGDKSTGYAAKCRKFRLAQTFALSETSLDLFSQTMTKESLPSYDRDDTQSTSLLDDQITSQSPVPEVSGPNVVPVSSKKRRRHTDFAPECHRRSTHSPSDKKRKFTRRQTIGYARQRTTMDSYVSRLKKFLDGSMDAAGGSAAMEVVSTTSLVTPSVSSSIIPVDLIGQIENDYPCDAPATKRLRKEHATAFISASSTLEYDKRIADS